MSRNVSLPRILGFRLSDFHPIFQGDIDFRFQSGINIILGGNGLGKTTIMQAIVYALTGGSDENVEKIAAYRWDYKYFRSRLDRRIFSKSFVEVDFALGETICTVRRGFADSEILTFSDSLSDLVEEGAPAEQRFLNILSDSGYPDFESFSRLINRLIYLPESRQSLAWDFDTQFRLMTLTNQRYIFQEDLQKLREAITSMDTNHRHMVFGIGRLKSRIETLKEAELEKSGNEPPALPAETDIEKLSDLVKQLGAISESRQQLEGVRRKTSEELSVISNDLSDLRTKVEILEGALIAESLFEREKLNDLALEKITSYGICPACGTKQHDLKNAAKHFAEEHRCVLCGSDNPILEDPNLVGLRSQMNEKLRSQQHLQSEWRDLLARIRLLRQHEADLQLETNKLRSQQSILPLIERDKFPLGENLSDLEKQLEGFQRDEIELESQLQERRREFSEFYHEFRLQVDSEIRALGEIYQQYATAFLGIPCELREITQTDKGAKFTTFVPRFEGIDRKSPKSCSEAQGFFLDIAFRMALIELTAQRRNEKATFICETPENALDVSYVNNVVHMFQQFVDKGHSIILTANIQEQGVAQKILTGKKSEKRKRILNLLDFGRISNVHREDIKNLNRIVRGILS